MFMANFVHSGLKNSRNVARMQGQHSYKSLCSEIRKGIPVTTTCSTLKIESTERQATQLPASYSHGSWFSMGVEQSIEGGKDHSLRLPFASISSIVHPLRIIERTRSNRADLAANSRKLLVL